MLVRPEATGGYSVSMPTLPGCHSQGESLEEALAKAREAGDFWLEVHKVLTPGMQRGILRDAGLTEAAP